MQRVNAANPGARWPARGLYAVTAEDARTGRLVERCAAVLRGGAVALQYRSKDPDARRRHEQARALQALCADAAVPFIVNDDIELAAAVRADGVHLGTMDAPIPDARARLGGEAIIGATCHGDLERAQHARDAGADYLAFGAFHRSGSKPGAPVVPAEVLTAAARFGLPRVAIGGIRVDNARPLIRAGADLLAVIGALFDSDHPERRAAEFARLFETSPDDPCTDPT